MAKPDIKKPVLAKEYPKTKELTGAERKADIDQRAFAALQEGVEQCSFLPFSDMFIEFYPDDHPFIELSFTDNAINPTEFNNPYRGKGALVGFGRYCMRFLLDEQGLQDHIDHLTEILAYVKDFNKQGTAPDDIPPLTHMDKAGYLPDQKKHTLAEDEKELAGGATRRVQRHSSMEEVRRAEYDRLVKGKTS